MVGMVSGHHIMISTTLLANFDVCQKIFIRGTSCFGFEDDPHTGVPLKGGLHPYVWPSQNLKIGVK